MKDEQSESPSLVRAICCEPDISREFGDALLGTQKRETKYLT